MDGVLTKISVDEDGRSRINVVVNLGPDDEQSLKTCLRILRSAPCPETEDTDGQVTFTSLVPEDVNIGEYQIGDRVGFNLRDTLQPIGDLWKKH